jgi:hypothetical protein
MNYARTAWLSHWAAKPVADLPKLHNPTAKWKREVECATSFINPHRWFALQVVHRHEAKVASLPVYKDYE